MENNVKCLHCGEDCGNHPVYVDGNPFCCHGCATVYRLLGENRLGKYYTLMDTPGIRLPEDKPASLKQFSFLDKEEVVSALLDFHHEEVSQVRFYVPAIHCSSCIWLLENLHRMHNGVVQSTVNFLRKEVSITFRHGEISLRELAELLASVHYIPEITLDSIDRKAPDTGHRKVVRQLGVAAFCFGNTMLFSFPEYLAIGDTLDPAFRSLFNFLNLLLGTLVLLYSGRDYFISAWKNLRHGILNLDLPVSIGMLALYGQSVASVVWMQGHGYFDSLAGFLFFLLIGKWYQARTYDALSFERDYRSYFPVGVTRLEGENETSILLSDLRKGDRVRIRNLELIPADGILKEGSAAIDYSFVTGESRPVAPQPGEAVYAGGRQAGSSIVVELTHEVDQSRLTRLWNQDVRFRKPASGLQTTIDYISRFFVYGLLTVSLLTLVYHGVFSSGIAVKAFVSVLIVACPCALALTLPFTFGNTQRMFGRNGLYLKSTSVVEDLARVDTVVFDKTGTLTRANVYEVSYQGRELDEMEILSLRSLFRNSTHPLSVAVFRYIGDGPVEPVERFREVPARGLAGMVQGREIRAGSASFVGADADESASGSRVYIKTGEECPGYFFVGSRLREGWDEVAKKLGLTYDLHLISGDSPDASRQVAKWFGEGKSHFGLSPSGKKEYIERLKNEGRQVLMVGDGLNDAGALASGRVGISVADNIYHFTPASDAILEAASFSSFARFMGFARDNLRIIRISMGISVVYNIAGLYFAVQGLLTPVLAAILMPASSVTVVAFTTLATNYLSGKWLGKSSAEGKNADTN